MPSSCPLPPNEGLAPPNLPPNKDSITPLFESRYHLKTQSRSTVFFFDFCGILFVCLFVCLRFVLNILLLLVVVVLVIIIIITIVVVVAVVVVVVVVVVDIKSTGSNKDQT